MQKTLMYIAGGILLVTIIISFLTNLASMIVPIVGFTIAVILTIFAFTRKKDTYDEKGKDGDGKDVNIDFSTHNNLRGKATKVLGIKETPIYVFDNFLTPT